MNGIFEHQIQKIDRLQSDKQNHSVRWVKICKNESIVNLLHTQSNNSACVVGSDDELSSSSEFVLKFSCSSGDKSYEPRLVTRKRTRRRSDSSKSKQVAEHFEPRIQNQGKSYPTYSIEEKTEVDTNTPSTTILIWSDEESGCSVQSKSLVLDINMNQNMTKKDLVTKRPYTPCDLVSKHLRRNRAFLNTNGSARRYHSQDLSCSKTSSSSSPDSVNLVNEKKILPELHSPELNTHNVKSVSLPDKTNKIKSLMSELQARRLSDGKEMIIGDSRKVLGMLERLKTVEFTGTCPSSRSILWPIPKECPPGEEVRDIREMSDFSLPEEVYNVYSLIAICTARCQLPTYVASSSVWNSSRELPSEAVQLELPNVDDCTFDTANPNISSPVVEADVVYPAVRPMLNDHSEIGTQMGLIIGDESLKVVDSKSITNEPLNASTDQSTKASNELGGGEPTPAVAASRKKFRRRVKISLHQCPMPSELEAPSLVVRLRIDPLSDSEAVSSKTQCQKVEASPKEVIKPEKMEMKYDALERRKVSSWMPINYMRSVDLTPDIRLDERERFTGMAECLITSLSSLSIPVSEVESIDTSFSWSLPEPNSQQSKSARQASIPPDAVLVEVLSEEDNSRKSISPEKSGSEVYCVGHGSSKTPSIVSSQLESQRTSSTEANRMPKDTKSGDVCKCKKVAGDSPVVDTKQREQEDVINHHERRPHYRVEKGVSAARPIAKVIRTKAVMYGMRASNVQSSKAAVNEVTERRDTDSVRGDEAPYYTAYRPTEYEKGDEVINLTLPYPEPQLPSHSATAVTQIPGLDEDNELSYWAVEAEKIPCTDAWGERQNRPKMLVSKRSQCDEMEIKAALHAIATPNIHPSIRTEVAATQTKTLDIAEPRKLARKPPRLNSTGLIWKVNPYAARSQMIQRSIEAEKSKTMSHISSVDTYSRGFFHKKKPLFRSGEMTISEFEELKQKIAESPLDAKVVRRSEKTIPEKPTNLTSIASELEHAQPVDYEGGDMCGTLNFCMPTGYGNVRNQEFVKRQTHPRMASEDRHTKTRFGFPCAPPGPLPNDGVKVAIRPKRQSAVTANVHPLLSIDSVLNRRNEQFSSNNSLDTGHPNPDLQKTSLQCIITLDDHQDYPNKQISAETSQNNSSQIYPLPLLATKEGIHQIPPRNCAFQWSIINVALLEQESSDILDYIKLPKPTRMGNTVWAVVRFLCCGFLIAPKWTISATQMYSCFIECPYFARPLYQHSTVLCDEAQHFSTESIKVIGLRLLNLPSHLEYQSEYTGLFCQKAYVIMLGSDSWMKLTNLLAYLLVWGSDNAPVLWNDSAKNAIIPRSVISKGQSVEGKKQRLFYTRSLKLKGNENYQWCLGMSQALAFESEKLNLPSICTIKPGVSKRKDSRRKSNVPDESLKPGAGSSISTIKFIGKVLKSIFASKRKHNSASKQGEIPSPCYLQAQTVNGRISGRTNTRDPGHFRWAVVSQDQLTIDFDATNPIKQFQRVTRAKVTIVDRNAEHLNGDSISQCNKFGTVTVHRPEYHPAYCGQDAFRVQKIGIRRNPPVRELSNLSERMRRGDYADSPYFQPHFYRKKVRRLSSERQGSCNVFAGTIQRTFSSSNLEALRKHTQSEAGDELSRLTEVTIVQSSPPVYVSTQDAEPEFSIYQSIKTPTGTQCERPKSVRQCSLVSHVENCRISGFGDVWTPDETGFSTSDGKIVNDAEPEKSNSSLSGSVNMESSIELTFSTTATSSINSDDFLRSYSTTTSVTVDNGATSSGNEAQISQRESSAEVAAQSTTKESDVKSLGRNFTPSGQISSRRKTLGRRKKSPPDNTTDGRNNQIISKATLLTDNHILQKLGNKAHLEASTKVISDKPAKRKQQPDWRQMENCDSAIAYVDLTEALSTTVDPCDIFLSCDHANTVTYE